MYSDREVAQCMESFAASFATELRRFPARYDPYTEMYKLTDGSVLTVKAGIDQRSEPTGNGEPNADR